MFVFFFAFELPNVETSDWFWKLVKEWKGRTVVYVVSGGDVDVGIVESDSFSSLANVDSLKSCQKTAFTAVSVPFLFRKWILYYVPRSKTVLCSKRSATARDASLKIEFHMLGSEFLLLESVSVILK